MTFFFYISIPGDQQRIIFAALGVTEKRAQFCHLVEKGHVWKESGATTEGSMGMEACTLLQGNDKINVIAHKKSSYF